MSTNNNIIRLETKEDHRAVENLVRESFWNVYRPGCSEHLVIHVLRDDPAFIPELDFVVEQDAAPPLMRPVRRGAVQPGHCGCVHRRAGKDARRRTGHDGLYPRTHTVRV